MILQKKSQKEFKITNITKLKQKTKNKKQKTKNKKKKKKIIISYTILFSIH